MARRPIFAGGAVITLLIVLALPAIAARPLAQPLSPEQANKPPKDEQSPVTLTGTISATTDADGLPMFTLQSGETSYSLDGGPSWFYGDDHPINAYVGQSVTVVGAVAGGSTEVDVESVDGKALRESGKPPWAGGWRVVGESHPGWSQQKADRTSAKLGECFPPGHCKEKPNKPATSPPH